MMEKIRSVLQFDIVFFGFAFYLISKGLLRREDSFLTAETGLGYMLGIVGGTMMLLLLLYPLRKHVRLFNALVDYAIYCGTGAKTTMGMGQTRRIRASS